MNSAFDSHSLGKLGDDYREIQAPPALLKGVLAKTDARDTTLNWWLPTSGVLASLTLLTIMTGYLTTENTQIQQATIAKKSLPNMSSLASLSIDKPGNVSLSHLNIRSLSVPAMPSAPQVRPVSKPPRKNIHEVKLENSKENENVYS
ncbi:MAG: hypothetical protein AB8B81_18210 [Halioglobus sp.]